MEMQNMKTSDKFLTCLDCGLLWNRLPSERVAKTIKALGKDETKRKLNI